MLKSNPITYSMARSLKGLCRDAVLNNGFLRPRLGRLFTYVAPENKFLLDCSRILHIGANDGAEARYYDSLGLEVIWIEPIPDVYDKLVSNIKPYSRQSAIKALLAAEPGQTITLNISNNAGASSSIFDLGDHKIAWPDVDYVSSITCVSTTLDAIYEQVGPVDAIIIDVQGAEVMVFEGGASALREVKYIKSEATDFNCYDGACTDVDVINFLEPFGFEVIGRSIFMVKEGLGSCFDLVFAKRPSKEA